MSSIFGIIQFNQKPLEAVTLQTMQQRLNHWNADDTGIWQNGSVGLGHLMLWNTPESLQEKLPLHNALSGLTITADARIDNREELFEKLCIEHSLRNEIPDSSLILKAYEKYSEDCVQHLIGDFAFAIWDENKQQLFCARDQMGVKPFFYYNDENVFAFASEKKGILCLENINKCINKQYFYNSTQVQAPQFPNETLYKKIKRILPASYAILHKESFTTYRYWELDTQSEHYFKSKEDCYLQLKQIFERAVECRLRSISPISAELSGGIDSSSIIGVAEKILSISDKHIYSFSNVLPETAENRYKYMEERQNIESIIQFNNLKNHYYITAIGFKNFIEESSFSLNVNDGLETWNSEWLSPIKKEVQKKGSRTVLSGFLGDEIFDCSAHHSLLDILEKKQFIRFIATKEVAFIQKIYWLLNTIIPFKLFSTFRHTANYLGFYSSKIRMAAKVFNIPSEYKKKMNWPIWQNKYYKERFKNFRSFQAYKILNTFAFARLESETRSGLYFRIEPRFPMADIRLIQFYVSIPNHLKYENDLRRYTFIKSVSEYLPAALGSQNYKSAFTAPFRNVLFLKQFEESLGLLKDLKQETCFINPSLNIESLKSDNIFNYRRKEFLVRNKISLFLFQVLNNKRF